VTAICGGGTSGPKIGTAAVVDYTAGLIAAIFATYDIAWLIPIIPLVGLAPLTLSSFCAADPPAVPTFTSAETNALLQLTFGSDFDSGLAKVRDLILNAIWYDACQCTSGSLAPLTPPTPPTGTPITQFPVAPTNQPCQSTEYTSTFFLTSASINRSGPSINTGIVPTAIRYKMRPVWQNTNPGVFTWAFKQLDQSGATQRTDTFTLTYPNVSFDATVAAIPNFREIALLQSYVSGSNGQSIEHSVVEFWCGAAPGSAQTPCCPPDPATQSYLDNILQLVTLIQRQIVPFAYVPGNVHTGLSGAGVLAIHGLLGIKIEITTDPTNLGVEGTSPSLLFDRGFFTWGSPDGYPQSERLERTNQISLPCRASAFSELAYDLHPGVVVTITELVREP
jgi:hypothetical protein